MLRETYRRNQCSLNPDKVLRGTKAKTAVDPMGCPVFPLNLSKNNGEAEREKRVDVAHGWQIYLGKV